MKIAMAKISKLNLFYLFSILLLLSGNQSLGIGIDIPIIKAGTAKITGRISPNDTTTNNTSVDFMFHIQFQEKTFNIKQLLIA
jgi:hypothetical protein